MKINCIIDTCSCIILSNSEFNQKSLLACLNSKVNLNYSNEIHKELRDHKDKNLPNFIHETRKRRRVLKFSYEKYELRMLGKTLLSRAEKGDKGEVDNFLLCVDQAHHVQSGTLLFVTDDKKSLRGILNEWLKSFPVINIWSSYEVILYLYAESIIPSKEIAIEKIKDVISFSAPAKDQRTPKTAQELIAVLKEYSNRINKISTLIK